MDFLTVRGRSGKPSPQQAKNGSGRGVRMIGVPGFRPVLLISALVVVAAAAIVVWRYELRPAPTEQAVAATPQRAEPRALTPEEETYAAALWEIQRQVTASAVAMTYAGIAYEVDNHDVHVFEQKVEP